MDERLRELERRAAAGDRAAQAELQAGRRRAGPSDVAAALLAAHRELTGKEHDPEHPAKLDVDQSVALIEAVYRARGWEPGKRMKDALVSPDGERRLVWKTGRKTLRRERKGEDGGWTRDERCDPPGETLHTRKLALRWLDDAARTGRVSEEAVECAACAGRGWVLADPAIGMYFRSLVRCLACALFPDDEAAQARALRTNRVMRGPKGWSEEEVNLGAVFFDLLERLPQGPAGMVNVLDPAAELVIEGARQETARGTAAIVEALRRAGLRAPADGAEAYPTAFSRERGEVSGPYSGPDSSGRLALEVAGGLIVRVRLTLDP